MGEDVLAEGKHLLDPSQISAFIEGREEVEDAESLKELEDINKRSSEKYAALVASLHKDFDATDLESAKRHTIELQYLTKLREELANKMFALQDEER